MGAKFDNSWHFPENEVKTKSNIKNNALRVL